MNDRQRCAPRRVAADRQNVPWYIDKLLSLLCFKVSHSTSMGTREVWIFLCPSWPQQCSPLSTVFDLIKVSDEEHQALGGGPIVTVDRYE